MAAIAVALPWLYVRIKNFMIKTAKAKIAKGAVANSDKKLYTERNALSKACDTAEAKGSKKIGTTTNAPLSGHIIKETNASKNVLIQKLIGLSAHLKVEPHFVKKIYLAKKSEFLSVNSAVEKAKKIVVVSAKKTVIAVKSIIATSVKNVFVSHASKLNKMQGTEILFKKGFPVVAAANFDRRNGITTTAESANPQEVNAKANYASITFVDIQRAPITEVKAFLYAWAMPEQVENRLKIYQPYSAIQTGNRVAVDMESESAFWANPIMEDNRLKLVFAETATQTDNRLEVR